MNALREITLSGLITISDIQSWIPAGTAVTFKIRKAATFAPLAESFALMRLHDFVNSGTKIRVHCHFSVSPADAQVGILGTLFGLALMLQSAAGEDGVSDTHAAMLDALWQRFRRSRGRFGTGQHAYLASRDPDCPIPPCLEPAPPAVFPLPTELERALNETVRSMTGSPIFVGSFAEGDLGICLYEAARNSFDHARVDANGRAIAGIRGVIVEKLIFHSFDQIDKRNDLNELLRAYVKRVWADMPEKTLLGFTVCDLGPGIHHTLPSHPGENGWEKLVRAFRVGESRKPPGSDATRGQGLDKLLGAARRLKAFLLVRSSELVGYRDFSTEKVISEQALQIWPWSKGIPGCGTSLSVLWPAGKAAGDFNTFGQGT
jgi:hypothetical protein